MAASKESESKSAAKKSSSQKKISKRVPNPYTGRYQVIEGKNEIDLENKHQALLEKWDREQAKENARLAEEEAKQQAQQERENYIYDMHARATEETDKAQRRLQRLKHLHCFPKPHIATVDKYAHSMASVEVKKLRVFFPDKQDYMRDEKIGWLKTALHRLNNDWFSEDFARAEKAYQEALTKANEEQMASDQEYARALQEKEIPYRQKMGRMARCHEKEVFEYFHYALEADDFNLAGSRFTKEYLDRSYSPRTKELSLGYRIPNLQELDLFESISYNEKADTFEDHDYSPVQLQQHALEIAESIIFRAFIVLFMSDEYQVLNSVDIVAYITYLDDAYGKEILKPVMRVQMTKKQFDQLGDLSKVNAHSLFTRELNVTSVSGLYLKKDYEIPSLNLMSNEGNDSDQRSDL